LEISRRNGKTIASVYRHIHDFGAFSAQKEIIGCKDNITLRIVTTRENYEFYAADILIDRISYAGLTTGCTCGNCFTGTLLGIFSQEGKAVFLDGIRVEETETT
ncbi:MAG: hypothetical protein IJT86_02040, partial [Spirochaetales bacterium]|nr:hypothetical protein [Spirochaetales bacterium]